MKIAYNPLGSGALPKAPDNKDITFDLAGKVIYALGVPFDGKDTKYTVFKKHTSSDNKGGSEGLVPIPSYSTTNNRLLREDGLWINVTGITPPDAELSTESTNAVQNKVITNKINEILTSIQLKAADVYKNVKVGNTTLVASGINDTLEFKLGNGIIITPNATNKTLEFSINATGNLGINTSYSNNQLVVKILDEYYNKWNAVYNWYISVTEEDTDNLINKWLEIVDFLNSIAEGTDILDEFVTRKTDLTIIGTKTFNLQIISTVAEGTSPFIVDSSTRVLKLNADMVDNYHIRKWFDNASDIDNSAVLWQSSGTCSDIPSMAYSALINVVGDTGRRWQIWNSRNNHQLYWRPELSDMTGYAPEHILLDNINYKEFIEQMYWANVPISSTSNDKTTPTFANTTVNGIVTVNGPQNALTINSSGKSAYTLFIKMINPNMSTYHTSLLAFGYDQTAYNLGYIGFKFVAKDSKSNMVTLGLHSVDHVLNITGNGFVGIGTEAPTASLSVNGHVHIGNSSGVLSSPWKSGIVIGPDGTDKIVATYLASATNGATIGAHNSALSAWAPLHLGGTNIQFRVNESLKMILTTSGLLAILKTGASTNSGLVVGGDSSKSNINSAVADQTAMIQLVAGSGGNTNSTAIGFHNPGISSAALEYRNTDVNTGYFKFRSDDSTWGVGINNTGNPRGLLDVNGDIYTNPYIRFVDSQRYCGYFSGGKYLELHNGVGGVGIHLFDDGNAYVYKSGNRYTIIHSGNYSSYALPFYTKTSGDCNSMSLGLTVLTAVASNQYGGNHSAFLTITSIGTPFQLQIPDSSEAYIYKRYKSGSSWSGWSKLSAGYADSAGTSSNVVVNNSDANSTYRMVWHSGNTLYSTAGIYCIPSSDILNATAYTINGASSEGANYITGTAGRIFFGGNFHIDALGANHLYLNHYTGYNVYMCSGSSQGSVGIGTSGPADKLDVVGIIRSTANSRYLRIGPQNSSHAHYETNADISHWFNKRVDVNGAIWRYNTNYGIDSDGSFYAKVVYANRDGSSTGGGVSLYSTSDPMTYGIAFRGTGTYGTHGGVSGDWATYLTMSDTTNRGWIFRRGSSNVFSISGTGYISSNNSGYFAGNLSSANSGASSPGDAALEVREYARAGTNTSTAPHSLLYAPRVGFHWGSRYWGNIIYYDSTFRFMNHNASAYAPIQASTITGGTGNFTNLTVINDSSNTGYDALAYFRNYGNADWAVKIDCSTSYTYGLHINSGGDYALMVGPGNSKFTGAVTIGADATPSYTLDVRGKIRATSRIYANEWIEFSSGTGLYWPNSYSAHFYPNDTSSHGQFRLAGSKGGYSGIHFGSGTGYMTLMDNGSDKGAYQENWGWLWYFNARNGRLSLRTSSDLGADVSINGSVRTNSVIYSYGLYHLSYGSSAYALTSDGGVAHIGSMSVNYATYARYVYCTSGSYLNFQWSGQGGLPTWLFGSNDGANVYVWNPSNFSVNYATTAGTANSVAWANVTGKPTIPSVGNGTVTIKLAGVSKGSFTMNQSGNTTIELTDNNTTYSFAAKGSTTRGIYLSGTNTFTTMLYSLAANVNSGTTSKLAYYSGANAISAYTSTVGSSVLPIYLNAGVPTACSVPMVRYWAIYSINNLTYTKQAGNISPITSIARMLNNNSGAYCVYCSFPTGYSFNTTMIWGAGSHESTTSTPSEKGTLYVSVTAGANSYFYVRTSNDSTTDNGQYRLFFLCIG